MRIDQDIKPTEIVDESLRLFALDQPSLKALSYVLRHKELWPKGFEWNFSSCSTCAMGMADQLWSLGGYQVGHGAMLFVNFGLDVSVQATLFTGCGYSTPMHLISPEMVADKIDQYLGKST